MATKTKYPSTKRFGSRYGRKTKFKLGKIEKERKDSKKCPYCLKNKVRRISMGIWFCDKCKNKFTGRAYSVGVRVISEETLAPQVGQEVKPEEKKEAEEDKEEVKIEKW